MHAGDLVRNTLITKSLEVCVSLMSILPEVVPTFSFSRLVGQAPESRGTC